MGNRKGKLRPHLWLHQGEVPHLQHRAWLQMRAQANYRQEGFPLTLEEFQEIWGNHWHQKGRGINDYCLTRHDPTQPWTKENTICIKRADHFKLTRELRRRKRWPT